MIRVLLADDHTLFREGLRALFASEGDIEVVGEACDGEEAVRKAHELRPDLVVMAEWSFKVLGDKVAQLEALGIPVLVVDYNAQEPARHIAGNSEAR